MSKPTEEEYREAAVIWRASHTRDKYILVHEKGIKIKNGKIIHLGRRMEYMCHHLDSLSDEQKEFWKDYGLFYSKNKCKKKNKKKNEKKLQEQIGIVASRVFHQYGIPLSFLLFMYETAQEYILLDIGLEKDLNKKIGKIQTYQLNADEIEESYFIAFSFKRRVLEHKEKELLRRDELLRQYIIDWHYYTEEEKQIEINKQSLNPEECLFINQTRDEIDALIRAVKKEKLK